MAVNAGTVLFSHPAARLIKTVPPLESPRRYNGHIPHNAIGLGPLKGSLPESSGAILTDWMGPVELQAVASQSPSLKSAGTLILTVTAVGKGPQVLPFRSFAHDAPMPSDTVPRMTYLGVGAGLHGTEGGSFWFFEDIREPGAADRLRWERQGVGRRAIWTVWLFGASAPYVDLLRSLLADYPVPPPHLPAYLRDQTSPWRDNLNVLPSQGSVPRSSPQFDYKQKHGLAAAPPRAARPLPPLPIEISPPESDDKIDATFSRISSFSNGAEAQVTNSTLVEQTAGILADVPAGDQGPADKRPVGFPRREATTSSYRHSLVAVDSESGTILGVIATDIHLDQDEKGGTLSGPNTPRASVIRPASVYRDEEALRPSSRPGSVLREDTFAPPPVPEKSEDHATTRDSMTSAAFFTAPEDTASRCASPRLANVVSLDHLRQRHGIETHRADLLRDRARTGETDDDDDGMASDASGSTVGGPAVRLWNKARGDKKEQRKRAAKKSSARANTDPQPLSSDSLALEGQHDVVKVLREPEGIATKATARLSTATLEDLEPEAEPSVVEPAVSPLSAKKLLHGHTPRALMATEDVIMTEDQIWRDAIEANHLPIDGEYTHLVALPGIGSPPEMEDDSGDDDLSLEPTAQDAREIHLPERKYLQGGTVLLEFLAGGSRIGASLMSATQANTDTENTAESRATSWSSLDGVFSLMPALPWHFVPFWSSSVQREDPSKQGEGHNTPEAIPTSTSASLATSITSVLDGLLNISSFAVTAPSALLNWFAMPNPPESPRTQTDEEEDDQWELAIPDFDPNSLASTPRPIYRRKRPAPSITGGFQVRTPKTGDTPLPRVAEKEAVKGKASKGSIDTLNNEPPPQAQNNRYSIIHFDGDGVGRRAFFRQQDVGLGGPPLGGMGGVIGVL